VAAVAEAGKFFLWLAECAAEVLAYSWPISVVVFVVGVAATVFRSPFRNSRLRNSLSFLAVTYAFPLVILCFATLFRWKMPNSPPPTWREGPAWVGYVLEGLVILHASMLIVAAIAIKGMRVRVALILAPGLWLSLCASFPAASAVSGVWP
jgi:hypothetical protein